MSRVSETGFYGTAVHGGGTADINFEYDIYVKDRIRLGTNGPRQVGQPFGFMLENASGEAGHRFLVVLGHSDVAPGIPVPNAVALTIPIRPDNVTSIGLGFSFLLVCWTCSSSAH